MGKKEKSNVNGKKSKKLRVVGVVLLTVAVCSCILKMCEELTNCAYKKMK
ncbi:hypothetical protein AALB53_17660 [Lachnospiraceae bacterium 47-T17]